MDRVTLPRVRVAALVLLGMVGPAACGAEEGDQLAAPRSDGYSHTEELVPPPQLGSRTSFEFDVAFRAPDPGAVVVRYGESSTCPLTGVDAEVRESAGEVVVTLTADLPEHSTPCTADYGARDVTVRLDAPLGDRRVVDGANSNEVAVATGKPPGPAGSPVPLPSR